MFKVPESWKLYIFILYGIGIGYYGAFDSKNFLILGIPMIFILKNTKFYNVTTSSQVQNDLSSQDTFQKQHVLAFGLSCVRDVIDLVRTWNAGQHAQVKVKTDQILKKLMNAADPRNILTGNLMIQEEKNVPKIEQLN
jgi:hypothetical protein